MTIKGGGWEVVNLGISGFDWNNQSINPWGLPPPAFFRISPSYLLTLCQLLPPIFPIANSCNTSENYKLVSFTGENRGYQINLLATTVVKQRKMIRYLNFRPLYAQGLKWIWICRVGLNSVSNIWRFTYQIQVQPTLTQNRNYE